MNSPASPSHIHRPLPVPDFYLPERASQFWRVPYQERATRAIAWAKQHAITPASADQYKIALVLVDVQNTFCLPDFELFVGGRSGNGAVEDNQRLCNFIYQNLGVISKIVVTMDTHRAMQIFHPVFLVDEFGHHPTALTLVSHADVVSGKWRFNPEIAASLEITPQAGQQHLLHYTAQLARHAKYDLTVWPYHAMLGGVGHALVSVVEEAVFFHTIARQSQADFVIKGEYATTENYSAIGPEVLTDSDDKQIAEKDLKLFRLVQSHDVVLIAGQAKSHCVAWTVDDLLAQIQERDTGLADRVYLLEDCTSPVVVPGIVDYSDAADEAYARFAQAGMHLIKATDSQVGWITR
jgi:nicotinamidase-related amidase